MAGASLGKALNAGIPILCSASGQSQRTGTAALRGEIRRGECGLPCRCLACVPTRASPETRPAPRSRKSMDKHPVFQHSLGWAGVAIYFRASDWLPGKDAAGTAGLGSGRDRRQMGRKSQLGTIGASKRRSCGYRRPRSSLLAALFSRINQRLQRGALIPEIKPSV